MVVVWSRLSYTLPAITRLLLSTVDRVDVVVERISYAFCSSRSKPDLCESPSGLTTPPPSFLPSFPFFLLPFLLASCAYTACRWLSPPCSLKSRVSGKPIWPEVSLSKAFRLWCRTLASPRFLIPPLLFRQTPLPDLSQGLTLLRGDNIVSISEIELPIRNTKSLCLCFN